MFADPSGEILTQLTRIADAMSRAMPTSVWTDWLKTVGSFVAGLATAYISLLLQSGASDKRVRSKMRRLVYSELAENFILLDSMVQAAQQTGQQGLIFELRQDPCTFDGESYMRENRTVFYELSEGTILTWLYKSFHMLRSGEKYPIAVFKSPLGFFSESFKTDATLRRYFKQFAGPARFGIIENAIQHYQRKMSIEDMIDSGMVVPTFASGPEPKVDSTK